MQIITNIVRRLRTRRYFVSYRTWAKHPGDRESWGHMDLYVTGKPKFSEVTNIIASNIEDDPSKVQILSINRI